MKISVVILTFNQKDYTLRCLHSLRDLMMRDDCEIIVVDNGSSDNTSSLIKKEFPDVKIISLSYNSGVAAGRNIGLKAASGKHLMILDNDTIADADTIIALSEFLESNPDVGLVAPRLVNPDGVTQSSFKKFPGLIEKISNIIRKKSASLADVVPDCCIEPFYVIGAAQMFPRAIFEDAGPLDEKIFFGPEDADFCIAVRKHGEKVVYNPDLTIIHDWQRTSSRSLLSPTSRRHIKALLYFYFKHHRFL